MIKFAVTETEWGAEVDRPIGMHLDHMLDLMTALGLQTADLVLTESIGLGDGMIRYLFRHRA